MFWALAIMGYKAVKIARERRLLDVDLVPVAEGMRILPEDTREFARQVLGRLRHRAGRQRPYPSIRQLDASAVDPGGTAVHESLVVPPPSPDHGTPVC